MKKSFINETGELVMEPPTPKTLVDVFSEVELIVEEKLDTAVNAFQQQESLPKGINIAGIDLTDDGKILTFEEQEKIEAHVSKLYKQRQKMRHLLAGVDSIFMPKTVFKDLAKELDLFMIYPTVSGKRIYSIPVDVAKKIRNYNQEFDIDVIIKSSIGFFLPLTMVAAISVFIYGYSAFLIFTSLLIGVCINNIYWIVKISITDNPTDDFNSLFPNHILKNTTEPTIGKDSVVHIKLPELKKSQSVTRKVMVDVWNKVGNRDGFQICTIADKKAINYEIQLGTSANPPQLESNDYDPGLFVEYGEYVAIIPATFYNITEMEQQFISKALEVGEKWDACAYIYN